MVPLRAWGEQLSCGDSPALGWDVPVMATGGCGRWTSVATKLTWWLLVLYLSRQGEFGFLGCL